MCAGYKESISNQEVGGRSGGVGRGRVVLSFQISSGGHSGYSS